MSIRWERGVFVARCDDCEEELSFNYARDLFQDVVDELKSKEYKWRNMQVDGKWGNYCPECYAKKTAPKKEETKSSEPKKVELDEYLLALGNLNCSLRSTYDGVLLVMMETKETFTESLKEILSRHGMTIQEKFPSVREAVMEVNKVLVDASEGTLLDRYNNNKHVIK